MSSDENQRIRAHMSVWLSGSGGFFSMPILWSNIDRYLIQAEDAATFAEFDRKMDEIVQAAQFVKGNLTETIAATGDSQHPFWQQLHTFPMVSVTITLIIEMQRAFGTSFDVTRVPSALDTLVWLATQIKQDLDRS